MLKMKWKKASPEGPRVLVIYQTKVPRLQSPRTRSACKDYDQPFYKTSPVPFLFSFIPELLLISFFICALHVPIAKRKANVHVGFFDPLDLTDLEDTGITN